MGYVTDAGFLPSVSNHFCRRIPYFVVFFVLKPVMGIATGHDVENKHNGNMDGIIKRMYAKGVVVVLFHQPEYITKHDQSLP